MLRKIKTQEEIDRKKKKNQIIIGVALVGLMVLSSLGYAFMNTEKGSSEKKAYNGIEFVRENGLWKAEISKVSFYFQYLPDELENVSVSGFFSLQNYAGKPLYLVNNNPASYEILSNLNNYISRYQDSCLNGLNCTNPELPEKTCDENVIIFENPEKDSGVKQDKNCIYISGDFIKSSDAFLYKLLGIK